MGFRNETPPPPLFRQLLGAAFESLPARVQELHDSKATRRWSGQAEVIGGTGALPRLIARLFGFPPPGADIPVEVTFQPDAGSERWTRNFAGKTFTSILTRGPGRQADLLVERFGLISVSLALVVDHDRLRLIPRRWTLAGIPMPRFLLPSASGLETQDQDRFCFDIEIAVPFIGRLIAYRGWLIPHRSA